MSDLDRMRSLVEKWHEGQVRRGPEQRPFVEHPFAVEKQLEDWGFSEQSNPFALCLALGHDMYKTADFDQFTFDEMIQDHRFPFGGQLAPAIRSLYFEINNTQCSFEEYDRQKAAHLRCIALSAPTDTLLVKIADRIVTTREFVIEKRKRKAAEYFDQGRILFRRVNSLPHAREIRKTYNEIKF